MGAIAQKTQVDDRRADAVAHALAALGAIAKHPEWPMRSAVGVAEVALRDIHELVTGENITLRSALVNRLEEATRELAAIRAALTRCELAIPPRESTSDWLAHVLQTLLFEQAAAVRMRALLDTPETEDFDKALPLEAAHQVKRWGSEHDAGKNPEDWFWLIGYLAGKALAAQKAGNDHKAQHHCISAAAALRNWHAHIRSGETTMRPGIEPPTEK